MAPPAKAAAGARAGQAQEPAEAIDPVCGMTVATAGAEFRSEYVGKNYYFCCGHCQHSFEKEPQKYLEAAAR